MQHSSFSLPQTEVSLSPRCPAFRCLCRMHPMRIIKAVFVLSLIALITLNIMISDLKESKSPETGGGARPSGSIINGDIDVTKRPAASVIAGFSHDVEVLLNLSAHRPHQTKHVHATKDNLTREKSDSNSSNSFRDLVTNTSNNHENVNQTKINNIEAKPPIVPILSRDQSPTVLPDHPLRPTIVEPKLTADNITSQLYREELRRIQLDINHHQFVHNSRRFGSNPLKVSPDSVVLVVQVHNRSQYLQHLVHSFRHATNIGKVLLIFSHDYYSENLNKIVDSIDFCPVLQIFYPYTIQAFPDQFPGKDPKDCPRDIGVKKAKELKCNNYKHPDKFGHYREAKYTATKHHWWWKIHRIFDELDIVADYEGPVLILEEDHYVAPDFLPTLKLMLGLKEKECGTCSLLALGNYDKKPTYGKMSGKVDIASWVSSKHNMGMVIDRKNFEMVKKCHREFCRFDDYNWDWSLQFISATCMKTPLQTMLMKSPRVFHIGECGLHHKGKNCTTEARITQIQTLLEANKEDLFPSSLTVNNRRIVMKPKPPKPNGGWGDIRDHELCMSYVTDKNQ